MQDLNQEQLAEKTKRYEKKKKKINRIKITGYIIFTSLVLCLFLYLRLVNTKFKLYWNDGIREISVLYSTAWIVKYPSEFEGEKVTVVNNSKDFFVRQCPYAKILYIEDGIESIGDSNNDNDMIDGNGYEGFKKSGLVAVRLPSSISYIGEHAFSECKKLRYLKMEEVQEGTIIDEGAFSSTSLKKIHIPEGVIKIKKSAFMYCEKLKTAVIADSVTELGNFTFMNCEKLKEVTLPADLETLPISFFYGCDRLKKVNNVENLRCISLGALYKTKVKKEDLPDNLYFASYGNTIKSEQNTENNEGMEITQDLWDVTVTEDTVVWNEEAENQYVSEKAGIDIQKFEEPVDSARIYIDGEYYTLPMKLEEFLQKDNWTEIGRFDRNRGNDPGLEIMVKHTVTGNTLTLYVPDTQNQSEEFITGLTNRTSASSCQLILPGGVANKYMQWYRPYELYNANMTDYSGHSWYISWVSGTYYLDFEEEKIRVDFTSDSEGFIDSITMEVAKD